MSGLVAKRRAEQAAAAKQAEGGGANESTPAQPPAKPARKLRQPYVAPERREFNIPQNVAKPNIPKPKQQENRSPKNAPKPTSPPPAEPAAKKPRMDEEKPSPVESPTASPPATPPPADWTSDFGRLIRQAIDNRRTCPFRTLGLAPSTSMPEVKKRWAKLCLLLHPDKAPAEWKSVPELVDANQAVNEAKRSIEQRFQAVAMVRPPAPSAHPNPYTLDKGTFGKRRVELRWQPSMTSNSKEKVDRYLVFILHGSDPRRRDQMLNLGSVKEGTDPFFVIVEDDQRYARFFTGTSNLTFTVLASNAAGNSEPLTIVVPLR